MRGNSGYIRWIITNNLPTSFQSNQTKKLQMSYWAIVVFAAVFTQLVPSISAVPLDRERRMIRDVFTEVVAVNQTTSPPPPVTTGVASIEKEALEAGGDTCLMDGQLIAAASVKCENKPGCRAIQKTGECCPEYQCECVRGDKTYSNGERLLDAETPCRACYCQAGEITCSVVTCYKRDDCQPKFIPGRCCPEYDNCPPLEDVGKSQNKTTPITEEVTTMVSTTSTTVAATMEPIQPIEAPKTDVNNPLGITIKEITKPEEIRITDKPKNSMISSKATSDDIISADVHDSEDTAIVSTVAFEVSTNANNNARNEEEKTNLADVHPDDNDSLDDSDEAGKAVRHAASGSINVEPHEEPQQSSTTESAAEMSSVTISDMPDASTAPAVGHQVVIVQHNGETKPITVFGAEGLQIVEQDDASSTPSSSTEVSDENASSVTYDSSSAMSEVSSYGTTETAFTETATKENVEHVAVSGYTSSEENSEESQLAEKKTDKRSSGRPDDFSAPPKSDESVISSKLDTKLFENANSNEETTTQSVASIILETTSSKSVEVSDVEAVKDLSEEGKSQEDTDPSKPNDKEHQDSSNSYITSEDPLAAASDKVYDTVYYSPNYSSETTLLYSGGSSESTTMELSSTTESVEQVVGTEDEDDNSDILENPEFPKIPDDVSYYASINTEEPANQQIMMPAQEQRKVLSEYTKDNKSEIAIIGSQENESPKLQDDSVMAEAITSIEKQDPTMSSIVIVTNDAAQSNESESKLAQLRLAPGEPLLIPEWEREDTTPDYANEEAEDDNNSSPNLSDDTIMASEESSGLSEIPSHARYIVNNDAEIFFNTFRDLWTLKNKI